MLCERAKEILDENTEHGSDTSKLSVSKAQAMTFNYRTMTGSFSGLEMSGGCHIQTKIGELKRLRAHYMGLRNIDNLAVFLKEGLSLKELTDNDKSVQDYGLP